LSKGADVYVPALINLARAVLVICISSAVVGCASANPETTIDVANLKGTEWVITKFPGVKIDTDRRQTLRVSEDAQVSGFSGCNSYTASPVLGDGSISFAEIAVTKRWCRNSAVKFESAYLEMLQKAVGWEVTGNALHLLDQNGNSLARFRRMGSEISTNI